MNLTVLLALILALGAVSLLRRFLPRLLVRHVARQALSEVGKRALNRVPEQISLIKTNAPQWKHAADVNQQSTPLINVGFTDLGAYTVDKMPGVHIRVLFHPETYVAAHIFDHPRVGSWIEFVTRYTDGGSHTLTTLPPTGLDHPVWVRMLRADKSMPTDQLYRQFLTQREWHNIKPLTAGDVVHEFEDGYLRLMIWRQNSGISPEEVAHVALKWARKQNATAAGAVS
jgi:hypothetical protein